MSRDAPYHQHISGVSTQNHSQTFIVSARDAYFTVSHNSKEASKQACRNALFLTDPHVDRERLVSAKGVRVAGTCEWITHDASYRIWLNSNSDGDGDTRLLWISGGPGKGKTMMSVFLTEELERHIAHIDSAELVFFFCSAEDEKRSTAISVLRGLIHQIIAKRPQLVEHALPYFETREITQQTVSSLETLWLIFRKLIADANLGTIFCVLDGLDECEESTLKVLLPRIVCLLTSESSLSTKGTTKGRFKLAIVSRDLPGLRDCTTRVRLDPDNDEKVASDIELFVSARVQELSRIEGFNKEFQASVQTALLQGAEGTFLWVGFVVDELLQQQTCSQILEALKDLPSGLPAIYSRMLRRIPAKQRTTSLTILRWVTIATRPLELRELAAAIGIQATPPMTMKRAVCDAIALCGPLLKVQEQGISLVHQSVRDYLLRIERDSDVVLEAFRLNFESSHLELARKCLDCVAQSDLQYRVVDLDDKLDFQVSPLLRYAALYWPEHAKSCSALAAKLFDPSKLFFKKKSPLRDYWFETCTRTSVYRSEPLPLLHLACILEIIPWVEVVGAEKSWWLGYHNCVNEKASNGMTALHLSAQRGKEAMVRLLLDKGADVKAKDNEGETVLHYAAWEDEEAIVRLLLDKGADVKAKDNDGRTVLHYAASSWTKNTAVLQLLVDRGADVKAKDNNGETVLHRAASLWREKEAVVQLLVDRGVDIEAKDKDGKTALHLAVLKEKKAVVRLLVDRGVNIEAKDKDGKTALYWAAERGREAMVQLLVDKGADVKAKNSDGKTALHYAVIESKTALHYATREGREAVVRLLVDLGADVDAKDTDGMTALHYAALLWRGEDTVVQLLVNLGADVKAKDNNGMMALHWAAWRTRSEAVVQLLVDLGADVKAEDNNGETALHWAASRTRSEAVVQLLVDLGADVEAKDTKGTTALHLVAREGEEALVRLLVDLGADVKTKDDNGMTALHCAASWTRNEAMVPLLVDLGADVEAKDSKGTTALHLAAWEGNDAVVRLLVDLGADLEGEGETGLYAAAMRGNTVVVRLLLDLRADAKARNNKGRTVLHWAAERVRNEVLVWLLLGVAMNAEAKDNKGE